jgi:hypothetical protein
VNGLDVVTSFVPDWTGNAGDTGTAEGHVHVQNTWVTCWVRVVYGGSGITVFNSIYMFPPLPIDTDRVRTLADTGRSSEANALGWGKMIDSSSSSNNHLVSVVAETTVLSARTATGFRLRYDEKLVDFDEPFTVAGGDVITFMCEYPAAGFELAGKVE